MGRFFLVICLMTLIFTEVSAQTVVRHERTVHGQSSPALKQAEESWEDVPPPVAEEPTDGEVITVYGPYGGSPQSTAAEPEWQGAGRGQEESLRVNSVDDEGAARARLEKFIGQEPKHGKLWLKEGTEKNLPFRDCIYMQGGTKRQEDFVIALRRQGNPEPSAPDLCSLVLLVGRGQLGRVTLNTEKLPHIEMEYGGMSKEIIFTESRVRLPVAFMLRIETEQVVEIASAENCWLLVNTDTGNHRLEMPADMRQAWLEVLE